MKFNYIFVLLLFYSNTSVAKDTLVLPDDIVASKAPFLANDATIDRLGFMAGRANPTNEQLRFCTSSQVNNSNQEEFNIESFNNLVLSTLTLVYLDTLSSDESRKTVINFFEDAQCDSSPVNKILTRDFFMKTEQNSSAATKNTFKANCNKYSDNLGVVADLTGTRECEQGTLLEVSTLYKSKQIPRHTKDRWMYLTETRECKKTYIQRDALCSGIVTPKIAYQEYQLSLKHQDKTIGPFAPIVISILAGGITAYYFSNKTDQKNLENTKQIKKSINEVKDLVKGLQQEVRELGQSIDANVRQHKIDDLTNKIFTIADSIDSKANDPDEWSREFDKQSKSLLSAFEEREKLREKIRNNIPKNIPKSYKQKNKHLGLYYDYYMKKVWPKYLSKLDESLLKCKTGVNFQISITHGKTFKSCNVKRLSQNLEDYSRRLSPFGHPNYTAYERLKHQASRFYQRLPDCFGCDENQSKNSNAKRLGFNEGYQEYSFIAELFHKK